MISEYTRDNPNLMKSPLFCPMDQSMIKLFFSLVDYRNNYFTNDDPNKIIEFYSGFYDRDQLIQWMSERPKGVANIHEIEGDKEIIVVIPTADFNGKYARECRDNIFKGLHIVYVESGGRGDFYFNYAHNCNVGIRKAMEYNPKWIVISNDDMYKIDDVNKLKTNLINLNEREIDVVFTEKSRYHSIPYMFGRKSLLYGIASMILSVFKGEIKWYFKIQKELKRFNVDLLFIKRLLINKFWIKYKSYFILTSDFTILSRNFYSDSYGIIFNETYINDSEDVELSLKLAHKKIRSVIINYNIGDYAGSSIGVNRQRYIRTICTRAYLTKRVEDCLLFGEE